MSCRQESDDGLPCRTRPRTARTASVLSLIYSRQQLSVTGPGHIVRRQSPLERKSDIMSQLRAVLIGATGLAGQQFIAALKEHPFIELTGLAASPRSAGKAYAEALRGANGMTAWFVPEPLPESIARLKVVSGEEVHARDYDIGFSAVESDVAQEMEPRLARDIP